jgi:hypothetical protein
MADVDPAVEEEWKRGVLGALRPQRLLEKPPIQRAGYTKRSKRSDRGRRVRDNPRRRR